MESFYLKEKKTYYFQPYNLSMVKLQYEKIPFRYLHSHTTLSKNFPWNSRLCFSSTVTTLQHICCQATIVKHKPKQKRPKWHSSLPSPHRERLSKHTPECARHLPGWRHGGRQAPCSACLILSAQACFEHSPLRDMQKMPNPLGSDKPL